MTPIDYAELQIRILNGLFIDGVERFDDGLAYCYSDLLPDLYWSFGYGLSPNAEKVQAQLSVVRDTAHCHDRIPAVYSFNDEELKTVRSLVDVKETHPDTWMLLEKKDYHPQAQAGSALKIAEVSDKSGQDDFMFLVNEVIIKVPENPVGYYGSPVEYLESCARAFNPGVSMDSFVGYVDGKPVVMAQICTGEGCAGLYSIGVHPDHRRKGYARAIVHHALSCAFEKGADSVFLQTDGVLPPLYKSAGFQELFTGHYLVF